VRKEGRGSLIEGPVKDEVLPFLSCGLTSVFETYQGMAQGGRFEKPVAAGKGEFGPGVISILEAGASHDRVCRGSKTYRETRMGKGSHSRWNDLKEIFLDQIKLKRENRLSIR